MKKNWWSKALSFFVAFLLILIPSYNSIADESFTGIKTVDGNQRSYIDGVLVKKAASIVGEELYYSDEDGNVTAKIYLKKGQNYSIVENQDGYATAYATNDKTGSNSTVKPGDYFIYKIFDGAINISTVKDVPGFWINPTESQKNMMRQFKGMDLSSKSNANGSSVVVSGGMVKITSSVKGYITAYDAINRTSSPVTVSAGNYYIYKTFDKAINVSTVKGQPGSWINAGDVKVNNQTASNSNASGEMLSGSRFKLNQATAGYVTADDAISKTSSANKLQAGTYYVYKSVKGALNISTQQGQPGSWINVGEVKNVSKPAPSKDSGSKLASGDKFKLTKSISGYMSGYDALQGKNPITSLTPDTYYIYKTYQTALNLTTVKGEAGSWVNPKELGVVVNKPKEPTTKESNTLSEGSSYKLTSSVPGYYNADYALLGVNSNSTVIAGNYYVYRVANNGAINITTVKGAPGFWIMPSAKVSVGTSNKPVVQDKSPVVPSTTDKFVIVIDPGHGAGIAHNRGGLLFNEGDQNYKFSQYFMAEANKYSNVIVKTTRPYNDSDPSLEDRARAGAGADLYLSLHTNAMPVTYSTTGKIIRGDNVRGVEVHSSNYSQNINMAYQITDMVSSTLGTPNRGVKFAQYSGEIYGRPIAGGKDYYAVFRNGNTAPTRYLIEFVFHTNLEDSQAYLYNQATLARNLMRIIAQNYDLY